MTGQSRALYEPDVLRLASRATAYLYVRADDAALIVYANETAERMFGYRFGELEGKSIDILLPEALQTTHPSHRQQYYLDPEIRPMGRGAKLYGRRRNGSQFPIVVSLAPGYFGGELHVLAMVTEWVEVPVAAPAGS